MNLVLLHPEDFSGDVAILSGRRAKHVHEVHRVVIGETLVAGLAGGSIGEACVLASSTDELRLSFTPSRPPPAPLGIDLLLAMPRPKILRRVLASATSLGVKRIALVNAARTEKAYFDSPLATEPAMREAMVLGLEQARDTVLPEVLVRKRFRPFVEDEAPVLWADAMRLVAHPVGSRAIAQCGAEPAKRRVVAIGPEGGWVPFEVSLLEAAGYVPLSLGERILRVDVAVPVILSQLDLVRRDS